MADEHFQKTPKKADRWFVAAIVFALLFAITFSLYSFLNWIFFFASAYSFFMSYFLLPVQPKIFQNQRKQRQTWGQPAQSQQQDPASKARRFVFTIVGGVFAMMVVFMFIDILSGDDEQATSTYEIEAEEEQTASGLISKGYDFYNKEEYDSADRYFDRAIELENSNMEAVYGKGIVLYSKGRKDEAEVLFRKAYDGGFRYAWLSWVLADMADKRGQKDEAIKLYKEEVELDSNDADAYRRLAELEPENRDKYLKLADKFATK